MSFAKTPDRSGIREGVAGLTEGVTRAARFVVKNPEEAANPDSRADDLDKNYLGDVIKELNESGVWPVNGGISRDTAKASVQSYVDGGVIKSIIPVQQVFDFRFVDAALKNLGTSP